MSTCHCECFKCYCCGRNCYCCYLIRNSAFYSANEVKPYLVSSSLSLWKACANYVGLATKILSHDSIFGPNHWICCTSSNLSIILASISSSVCPFLFKGPSTCMEKLFLTSCWPTLKISNLSPNNSVLIYHILMMSKCSQIHSFLILLFLVVLHIHLTFSILIYHLVLFFAVQKCETRLFEEHLEGYKLEIRQWTVWERVSLMHYPRHLKSRQTLE